MNLYDNLKILCNKINFKYINFNLINKNIDYLVKISNKIKKIWNNTTINDNFENISYNSEEYKYILKITINSFLSNKCINKFLNNSNNLVKISYFNVHFYYFYGNKLNEDKQIILNMLKITYCLNKFKFKNDNINRIIIWIPVINKRNYLHNKINNKELQKCEDKFEAFTPSGVTFEKQSKITIITRYEEIEKLLIHELIHNFDLDGSNQFNSIKDINDNYKKIKNNKNFDYEYSIFESYTELLATYFTLIFKNININDIKYLKEKYLSQIIIELLYSYNSIANLINLNNYKNWDEFIKNQSFKGNICIYEYYYIKGLMYNNFKLEMINDNNVKNIYNSINQMIINQSINNDLLLKNIFDLNFKQDNFKFIANTT